MNSSKKQEKNNEIRVDENEMRRLNQEMIISDLITPDRLYIDLILIKDLNIGTILSFLKERKSTIPQEEYVSLYNKIIEKLPEYNERRFDDFEHIFSFMKISNDQIKERMHDPRCASWIFNHSPTTKYLDVLKSQLAVNVNHSAVAGKKDPIEITINTYPLRLGKEDEFIIGFYLADKFKVNTRIIYIDMREIKLTTIHSFDEVYTYFLKELFDSEEIRRAYSELRFVTKRLYVPKLFGSKINKNRDSDQDALYLQSRVDVLTRFTLLPAQLFSAQPPTTGKDRSPNG